MVRRPVLPDTECFIVLGNPLCEGPICFADEVSSRLHAQHLLPGNLLQELACSSLCYATVVDPTSDTVAPF